WRSYRRADNTTRLATIANATAPNRRAERPLPSTAPARISALLCSCAIPTARTTRPPVGRLPVERRFARRATVKHAQEGVRGEGQRTGVDRASHGPREEDPKGRQRRADEHKYQCLREMMGEGAGPDEDRAVHQRRIARRPVT